MNKSAEWNKVSYYFLSLGSIYLFHDAVMFFHFVVLDFVTTD